MQCCIIYTCLRSCLSDSNLDHLKKVTIEGSPLKDVDFNAIMDIFKQKIGVLNFNLNNYKNKKNMWKILGGKKASWEGNIPGFPPPPV